MNQQQNIEQSQREIAQVETDSREKVAMQPDYVEWKWSKGEPLVKSTRSQKETYSQDTTMIPGDISIQETTMMNDPFGIPSGYMMKETKRISQNEKLSTRHMMIQKGINPFVNTTNYVDHLDTETSFLRPQDSNLKEKLGAS